jgi:hypothetical protein
MNKCSVQYRFIFLIVSGTYTQLNICTKTILYEVNRNYQFNYLCERICNYETGNIMKNKSILLKMPQNLNFV